MKCILVQSLSRVRLFVTPWTEANQATIYYIATDAHFYMF